ncbi:P-loop containing nucleoside triphosphate hydrolase protein [Mycena galopus ATCC 62051]|nr:P-loop containing nucleoside triphosphate hydrolase protein [Mycena galopus ATCC 62051]
MDRGVSGIRMLAEEDATAEAAGATTFLNWEGRQCGSLNARCPQRGIHTAHPSSLLVETIEVMSPQASESYPVNHINIQYGSVGGKGGTGGKQGGSRGAGEGPSINYAVKAENFNILQNHGPELEQRRMNLSEIKQSNTALALVRCPPPSQIFQGRQDILEKMDAYFSRDSRQRCTYVLHGLGGSGKTQIALKFLDRTNGYETPRSTKQFFINANSRQTLDAAFTNIAISQGIGKTSEHGSQWLISQIEDWMLLFDNADDPGIDLFAFFPRCTHGNIIVTSRNAQLATYGPRSHSRVGDLDETNAIDLPLLRAVKEKTIETTQWASEIVKELSCLPLAIIQAGAYISKFNCLQYLFLYRQNRANILRQHPTQSHDNYTWTVYTTWQISFNQLSNVAARFLQLCSLLHYNDIPVKIFEQAAEWMLNDDGQEAQTLQEARGFLHNFLSDSGTWNQQCLMDITAEIQGYSLIDRHDPGDTLSIHPLVHSWCLDTLDDEPIIRQCMTDIIGMSVKLTREAYLFRIGLSMFQGKFKEAKVLESMVLEKQKQLLGADHPNTLWTMANLGVTYSQLGRYQEAEPLQGTERQRHLKELCWRSRRSSLEKTILSAMADLAATYRELGRYREAEPLEGTMLEKQKELLGADHPHTLLAMASLAATYRQLGRYQEAEPLEGTALEKRTQLLGADHPDTLLAMANLATTSHQIGGKKCSVFTCLCSVM